MNSDVGRGIDFKQRTEKEMGFAFPSGLTEKQKKQK